MSAVPICMRIDKFLWCVRLCKTRSQAAELCRKGRVRSNDREARPAHEVRISDTIALRVPPIWKQYVVVALPTTLVGAKLVATLIREITPWEDLHKEDMARRVRAGASLEGQGRPTKKARRDLDRALGGSDA